MDPFYRVREYFFRNFHGNPLFVKAPGRINLAGEHLDYNKGFVLPAAIDRYIYFAVAHNSERNLVRIYSVDYSEYFETDTSGLLPVRNHWSNYLSGVIQLLQLYTGRTFTGFDVVFGGDLPQGAGLSSSAAVECGLARALCKLFEIEIDKMELAQLCMRAEHEYAGVHCGLLDQFACLFGKKDHVISMNCKTLQYRYIPFQNDAYSVLLFNTNKPHSLAENDEFNMRVASCHKGVAALQKNNFEIECLCDASVSELHAVKEQMDIDSYDRCLYIIEESVRYKKAVTALEKNDMKYFAGLLYQTQHGLKELYKISCPELDILIDFAKSRKEIYGAKLMGGGYGGCTINIVDKTAAANLADEAIALYNSNTPYRLSVYNVEMVDGAAVL